MAKIIGIDLGTSNSAAAVMSGGKPEIIPSAEGTILYGKAFPSFVAFTEDGEILVGEPARRQAVSNPERTIYAVKRKMGTDHTYEIDGKEYAPQDISAFILQKIKKDSEEYLGEKVEKAVITVPAYFNDNQRQATKDAGRIAGLEVVRIINEPTAASLAYGLDKKEKEMDILVFDFGGGTLDVTIMEFGEGVFEVKSTSGDTQLGGTDMDETVMNYIVDQFREEEGIDLSKDRKTLQRVREAGELAKIELSTTLKTEINLPYIAADDSGPKHLKMTLTRAKLEDLVRPIVERCGPSIRQALRDAKFSPDDIDKVILVGGPTRMPIVREFVEDFLGTKAERGIDPMECVAMGAAIQAGVLTGEVEDILLLDVTPLSLGVETLGGIFTKLIERNTTIPTKKSEIFSTAADNQTSVEIHILQGERPMAEDNVSLGRFHLVGIPPAPRGVPQIEVTFDIDADGILNVSAKDLGTGKEQKMTVTAPLKLSEDEIKQKVKEAERFSEEDERRRKEVQTKNEAEALVYSSENTLEEFEDKLADDVRARVEEAIEDLKKALGEEDVAEIKEKMEALRKEVQKVGAAVYEQVQQQQAAQPPPPGQEPETEKETEDEKVVDADYTVVDVEEEKD